MLFIQRDHFILSILVLGRVGYPSLLKHRKLDYLAPSPIYENENIKNRQKKPDYHYVKLLNKKFMILFIMIILLLLKMLLLRDLISLNYMELMVILLINSYMNVLIKEPINMVVVLKIDVDLCWN